MAEENNSASVLRQFEPARTASSPGGLKLVAGVLVLVVAGAVTGWLLAGRSSAGGSLSASKVGGQAEMATGENEVGVKDDRVFKDSAEGRIEANDFSKVKEGSHILLRAGGPSQTAYLTSSVVDLSQFEGKCVEVWGETFSAQEAGWFMDVGRVKTLSSCPEGL